MVFGMITFTRADYRTFENVKAKTRSATSSELKFLFDKLERNIKFLGITGIEDQLQDDLAQTLTRLRQSGIKLWVLTGDKMETAIHVAKASNLCKDDDDNIAIFAEKNAEDFTRKLNEVMKAKKQAEVIAIDGPSVSLMLADPELEKRFFNVAGDLDSVIFVRLTPN